MRTGTAVGIDRATDALDRQGAAMRGLPLRKPQAQAAGNHTLEETHRRGALKSRLLRAHGQTEKDDEACRRRTEPPVLSRHTFLAGVDDKRTVIGLLYRACGILSCYWDISLVLRRDIPYRSPPASRLDAAI